MILALPGCTSVNQPASGTDGSGAASETTAADESKEGTAASVTDDEKDAEILQMISEMSTEQKLSQMMIVALRSDPANTKTATKINEDYANLLKKYDFGGIILFTGNMTDAVLCAYQPYGSAHDEEGAGPFNLNVAVALCTAFGQSTPSGTLPVNVPKVTANAGEITFESDYLYERGFGLANWGK